MANENCTWKWNNDKQRCTCSTGSAAGNVAEATVRKPILYLTFDDGPYPITREVLHALGAAGLCGKAVFFLNGGNMANNPTRQAELVRQIIADGHGLANHGYSHEDEYQYMSKTDKFGPGASKQHDNLAQNVRYFRALLNDPSFRLDLCRLPGGADGTGGPYQPHKEDLKKDPPSRRLGSIHVGWDQEFSYDGWMQRLTTWTGGGVTGVEAEPSLNSLPKMMSQTQCIALLHDHHWVNRISTLTSLLIMLSSHFDCRKLTSAVKHWKMVQLDNEPLEDVALGQGVPAPEQATADDRGVETA